MPHLTEMRAELQAIEYFDLDFLAHYSSEDACLSFLMRQLHRQKVLHKIQDLVATN